MKTNVTVSTPQNSWESLAQQWVEAMRRSTDRAIGRECEYAMSPDEADAFDPLGLLAWLAGGWGDQPDRWFVPCDTGAFVSWRDADWLAFCVGLRPDALADLCAMNDAGTPWPEMAAWVEQQRAVVAA